MPTGTRPTPDANEVALAALIRGLVAAHRPAPLTQTELAHLTGIPQTTLSALFKPKNGMTVRQLIMIAKALGVDPGDLITEARRIADGDGDGWTAAKRLLG